jgi:hypothetical protein
MPLRPLALLLAATATAGAEVRLAAPLGTLLAAEGSCPGGRMVEALVTVPADAPDEVGVGAWAGDRHGRWFGRAQALRLRPGRNQVRILLPADQPVAGPGGPWTAADAAEATRSGLFLWSLRPLAAPVTVDALRALPLPVVAGGCRLRDLRLVPRAISGERWTLETVPEPYPADPYDPEEFTLDLVVTAPDGTQRRLPGFHLLPVALAEGGDREEARPAGAARFSVRWRPDRPGHHQLRLEARWRGQAALTCALPAIEVHGQACDRVVRIDPGDRRFLQDEGRFWWPLGPNLRSVWDTRSRDHLGTALTPDRGTRAYADYLARFAANGANAAEVWLSSWNLGLEWNRDWYGFHGVGRFNQFTAERLDRVLDLAWGRGMRLLLALNNHGQASDWCDQEWDLNPWNRANGGPFANALELFTDARARAAQDRLRRYLAGRCADHPALLGWKLWTEQDLTNAGRKLNDDSILRDWHEHACASFKRHDSYRHFLTTHWSTDYTQVYPRVAALPGLDALCIDAYHEPAGRPNGRLLADLLLAGSVHRAGLVRRFDKGVLVTEFGGSPQGAVPPQLEAEHASGAWAAMACGYLGAPMLWWSEWIDQGNRFAPYRALSRFLASEDLRTRPGSEARSLELKARGQAPEGLWSRAWMRPGLALGYLLDRRWGGNGSATPLTGTVVRIGDEVAAGALQVEWWDPATGQETARAAIDHPGGALELNVPPFTAHLAWKLRRR